MRKTIVPILALVIIAGVSCNQGKSKTQVKGALKKKAGKIYTFEKATIVSKSEIHPGISVEQDIYIDNYGAREARYTITKMSYNGQNVETRSLSMVTPEYIYSVDFQAKRGTKIPNDPEGVIEEMRKIIVSSKLSEATKTHLISSLPQEKDALKNSEATGLVIKDFIKDMKPVGQEEILGLNCDIYEIKDDSTGELQAKLYVWNNLPIKLVDAKGKVIQEVVSIDTTKVDTTKFVIPDSIKVEDWLVSFKSSVKQFEEQEAEQNKK